MSKRICPIHGLFEQGENYKGCPNCKKTNAKVYDRIQRNQESDKFYHSRAWKNKREQILSNNPFCVSCGKPAQMVDHKVAIKDGGSKLDDENLQPMCNPCHNIKENKEGNRWKK